MAATTLLNRPAVRASASAAAVVLVIVGALALLDPSGGLLAPVGGHGLPILGTGAVYRWAPLVIGLPVLLVATAAPVYALSRRGRTFVVAWAATVGAFAVAAAATGFAAALPLVGPHLSFWSALQHAVTTSGWAGAKGLVVGPLVAVAAALAHRFGSRATTDDTSEPDRDAVGVAVAVVLVVSVLAAVGFAATAWRGGPVGYAFAGPLVAPTAATGVLGTLAGIAVFVGAFALVVRWLTGRVVAAVWLAAVVAGLALGIVGAVIAAGTSRLPDAGPDSWWIATTLISLTTGIGYGVAVGLVATTVTAVAWRWRSRLPQAPHPRSRLVVGAAVAVLLLALPVLVGAPAAAGPQETAPVAPTGGMEPLTVLPAPEPGGLPIIGDVTGRQVVLRGVNVNQLIDYHLRDPEVPATQPLTDDDFAAIAAMGFNVVRLGMSWSRLEPTRGDLDEDYLDQVRAAVASAEEHGLYTVLDLHQDAWGNALARPEQQCDGGTSATTGWDGAPAWATITDGTLHCQFLARDLAPAVATAFGNFYTDRDGIQTALVRTWATVAGAFADEAAVAGYDLLNEPGIGAIPPTTSGLLLGRYYDAALTAIREAETTADGFHHLAFFEPSVLWSGLAFDVTPPPGFTDDRLLVFAPHPYSESITMEQAFGLTIASIERNLTVSARAAASYGAALWVGEWGWFGNPAIDGAKVDRFVDAQNRLGIGGAFWVWRQGCGSPETGSDATSSGNLVSVDCATGELSPPPEGYATPLSRAYPRDTRRPCPGRTRGRSPVGWTRWRPSRAVGTSRSLRPSTRTAPAARSTSGSRATRRRTSARRASTTWS
ncbi:glycoside hydrolase family 5 protein [Cellulomonas sp. Leaf395]|uniref:glycoside hydrolase family 5 protein n=1 Tax=Cellulomonas sp. Leaf395 TaxID=1736362 RepID=UPI000B12CA45|nr:cellulase family glycosylhydrolase [Cellulomonas sp. Leaf395]